MKNNDRVLLEDAELMLAFLKGNPTTQEEYFAQRRRRR